MAQEALPHGFRSTSGKDRVGPPSGRKQLEIESCNGHRRERPEQTGGQS